MSKSFLITAAAGDTGSKAARLLLEAGHSVRAMVRREDNRSKALADKGAQVFVGDFLDLNSLAEATKGIDGAYFCYPIKPGIIEATSYFAQAAKENGVKSIVNMSQISAKRDSLSHAAQDHWVSEQVFDWSGLNVAHIRPTFFAEWYLYLAPMIAQGKLYVPFKEDARHAPIAAEDQARVIAAILQNPEPHAGKVYPLFGPKELTQEEIAKEIGEALGKTIDYKHVNFDQFFEQMKLKRAAGSPAEELEQQSIREFLGQHLKEVALDHASGLFSGTNDLVEKIGGKPGTTVKQFVEQNRNRYESKVAV